MTSRRGKDRAYWATVSQWSSRELRTVSPSTGLVFTSAAAALGWEMPRGARSRRESWCYRDALQLL